jgi:hypothetical protein
MNDRAALGGGGLPVNPLRWKVITSGVDARQATMYALFGNDRAVQCARSNTAYKDAVLALVTWGQQEDGRWFGAQIPASPKSVEIVSVSPDATSYRTFEGSPLKEVTAPEPKERIGYLLSLRAAVMP